jgi:hypothetical protein
MPPITKQFAAGRRWDWERAPGTDEILGAAPGLTCRLAHLNPQNRWSNSTPILGSPDLKQSDKLREVRSGDIRHGPELEPAV